MSRDAVLVIGATGRVGGRAVERLLELGLRPRVFVRDGERAREQFGDRVEIQVGSMYRPADLDRACAGAGPVLLVTATDAAQFDRERLAIEAATRAEVPHLVKLSVTGAGANSPLEHGRWQGRANALLADSGLGWSVLQISFFMQNLTTMVHGGALPTSAGDGRLAMTDARDVGDAAAALVTDPPDWAIDRELVLSGPRALTFDECAEVLSAATGSRVTHLRVEGAQLAATLLQFGAQGWYADDIVRFNQMIENGEVAEITTTFRSITGADPRGLEGFAREYAAGLVTGAPGRRL